MKRGHDRSRRGAALAGAAAACLAVAAGCKAPVVGGPTNPATSSGPAIAITGATVDGTGHVRVSFTLSRDGAALGLDEAVALRPTFTLATLSAHPVDGIAAWRSLLLTGGQTLALLPAGGPGTPPAQVFANVKQPGSEISGTLAGADGEFTYVYENALPAGFDGRETVRVGVWLEAAAQGTPTTTSTFDFVPAGGAAAPRDTVLDANCNRCHGVVKRHEGRRVGVKICLTCHTWQHADPDTVDPAAMGGATAATDPNPLELGRMVHRIHRGKRLPTLHQSSSTDAAPALPSATALPLPFSPSRTSGATAVNPPIVGRKYSIVGAEGHEEVFGRIVNRIDNGQAAKVVAAGVTFPRDLRDCDACHGGAPQAYEVLYGISRRTCHGCHPDVWFEPTSISDTVHFAHPGGPKTDDTECRGCHVSANPPAQPKVYAPIADAHLPPHLSPRYAKPRIEIVSVQGLVPNGKPTVRFKLSDRLGTLSPPNNPTPANDTAPGGSPVPRLLSRVWIAVNGPTSDYTGPLVPAFSSSDTGNPNPLTLTADAEGVFTYTFASAVPASASGTWAVGMEARRGLATTHYDTAADDFRWPYTGETVSEIADNVVFYANVSGAAAVPRRRVVAQEKCDACHGRIALHGGIRNQAEYCLICHAPGRTDWASRPKLNGNVNLAATYDGIEERSTHFKVMVHRIHTGGRAGSSAGLPLLEPHVIYGYGSSPFFFDEAIFPNDLRKCTLCHEGKSYTIDSIPADALPTIANETPTILHQASVSHVAGEPATPPVQAACMSCHATGSMLSHVARHPAVAGAESCAACHLRGSLSVDVVHGLVSPDRAVVAASFSSIAQNVLAPRCASAACHGGSAPPAFPRLDPEAAYAELFQRPSQQASVNLVEPFDPAKSYLVLKLRGEAGSVGGVATTMPIGDAALDPSEIAAIEAWIANGAPND